MADLSRWGIEWEGPKQPICGLVADGYWTPWHIANDEIEHLRNVIKDFVEDDGATMSLADLEAQISDKRAEDQDGEK